MATKKKAKKKSTKSKNTARKKTVLKTVKRPKKLAKKSTKTKPAPKKAEKKKSRKKKASASQQGRIRSSRADTAFSARVPGLRSGEQSGDLQGLSRRESADSESVDELLEEGNAFEADAVIGVEDAGDADEREVHTHEVSEDDVPGEYLDED